MYGIFQLFHLSVLIHQAFQSYRLQNMLPHLCQIIQHWAAGHVEFHGSFLVVHTGRRLFEMTINNESFLSWLEHLCIFFSSSIYVYHSVIVQINTGKSS